MLKRHERAAFFYDLEVTSRAEGVKLPSIEELINAAKAVADGDGLVIPVGGGKASLKIRQIAIDSSSQTATLLVVISDKTAPDAVYSDLQADQYQVHKKSRSQGNEFGAHIIISLKPVTPGSSLYMTLVEGVPGLSHSIIRRAINSYIKRYHFDNEKYFKSPLQSGAKDKHGNPLKKAFVPRLDFHGHVSQDFVYQIENGTIQGISLFQPIQGANLGGVSYLKKKEAEIKVVLEGALPSQGLWSQLKAALKQESKKTNAVKIRFKQVDGQPKTVQIDPITGTPISQTYIKSEIYKNITPFLDNSAPQIVQHLADLLRATLIANR